MNLTTFEEMALNTADTEELVDTIHRLRVTIDVEVDLLHRVENCAVGYEQVLGKVYVLNDNFAKVKLDTLKYLEASMRKVVIYHGGCQDGFAAALAFYMTGKEYEFIPGYYNEPAPDLRNCAIYLVDFSFKKAVVEGLIANGNIVWHIDHHVTAIEDLKDVKNLLRYSNIEKSGCALAWEFLYKDKPLPKLFQHIQDRDLWKFELQGTKEICLALFGEKFDFQTWITYLEETHSLYTKGFFIASINEQEIKKLMSRHQSKIILNGVEYPCFNCPPKNVSDLGNAVSMEVPMCVSYYDIAGKRIFSLRSNKNNPNHIDVSKIASMFKGGGHKHAAGFSMPLPVINLESVNLEV
jgi:oligoribonuclease NrnB/cAMP/cGMP phosphodiesterase (DHH superfamily)